MKALSIHMSRIRMWQQGCGRRTNYTIGPMRGAPFAFLVVFGSWTNDKNSCVYMGTLERHISLDIYAKLI